MVGRGALCRVHAARAFASMPAAVAQAHLLLPLMRHFQGWFNFTGVVGNVAGADAAVIAAEQVQSTGPF